MKIMKNLSILLLSCFLIACSHENVTSSIHIETNNEINNSMNTVVSDKKIIDNENSNKNFCCKFQLRINFFSIVVSNNFNNLNRFCNYLIIYFNFMCDYNTIRNRHNLFLYKCKNKYPWGHSNNWKLLLANISLIEEKYKLSKQCSNINNVVGWVISAIKQDYKKPQQIAVQCSFNDYDQRNYDFDELEKKLWLLQSHI